MKKTSRKLIARAVTEFIVFAAILFAVRFVIYDKVDDMLISEIKGSIEQQSQSIAYTLNERFRHKLEELRTRAELLQENKMSAEDLLDVATIGTKTGRIRGILREDRTVMAGEPLPQDFIKNLDKTFKGEPTIDYIRDEGLLFAVPFEYENQTCIFYELFSDEAVQNFYKMMNYGGKGTLLLLKNATDWIIISEGLYPEVATKDYPKYDVSRYGNFEREEVEKLNGFESTWFELEHSVLMPGRANIIYVDNGIDVFFFYCTYISERDHLILSGYVEWDDAVVGLDHIYTMIDAIFWITLMLALILVAYLFRSRQAEILEHEKLVADFANKAKSDFLSNMSHEIRTPINAIIGMDEMILRESKESATIEYAYNLRNAATSLLELINDILDFSKIEAGKMEIIPVEYNICSMLNDLINMIQKRAENKGLFFEIEASENIPSVLFGDEIRIKQVITNILTNAVKYTEKGGVTLRVNYIPIDNKNVYLCISVSDTGIGIKKEDIKKLYSAFERIEEERNRKIEGTGLGMNITNKLLTMMGANLIVDSVYGQGSNFSFQIVQQVINSEPIGDYKESYKKSLAHHEVYHESFTAPDAKILVVDDTVMNLAVIKGLLKQTQIQIDTAADGRECLEMVKKNHYDIIFIDHMMPGMDGIETLRNMRKLKNNLNEKTPVISLTANAISGAREKYLAEGFQDYLTKPVDSVQLEKLIVELLPKDKVTVQIEKSDEEQTEQIQNDKVDSELNLPDWLKKIESLNLKAGIDNCGDEPTYLEILEVFANSIDSSSKEIENYFSNEDWKNYTTKVHALKSTSKIIGAEGLSALAKSLEDAGNADRIDEIKQNQPALMSLYLSYKEKLHPLINRHKENESEKTLIDEAELAEAFEAMKEIARSFDYNSMMFIFQSLDDYRLPENEIERYEKIKNAVENLEWEKVNELLNS